MEREGEEEASSGRKARRKTEEGTGEERTHRTRSIQAKQKSGRKDWMKIISNYLEEDGIGKQRSRYRSRRRRRRRRRRTFPFGRRQNEDGVRVRAPFCNGSQERSRVALEHVDEGGTRIGEGQNADSSHPLPPFQTQCARNVRLLFVFLSKSPRSESVERDRSKR